jgi:hypothetical protein
MEDAMAFQQDMASLSKGSGDGERGRVRLGRIC